MQLLAFILLENNETEDMCNLLPNWKILRLAGGSHSEWLQANTVSKAKAFNVVCKTEERIVIVVRWNPWQSIQSSKNQACLNEWFFYKQKGDDSTLKCTPIY